MAKLPTHEDDLQIEGFKNWLAETGASVEKSTSEWEVLRFVSLEPTSTSAETSRVTSVIYRNKTGKLKYTGVAEPRYLAFTTGMQATHYVEAAAPDLPKVKRNSTPQQITDLLHRDGNACFFCGLVFDEENPPTREHLVPVSLGGPNRLSNMVLAHEACNVLAGDASVMDKIVLRGHLHSFMENVPPWLHVDMNDFKSWLELETNWSPGAKMDPNGDRLMFDYEEKEDEPDVEDEFAGGYALFGSETGSG